MRLLRSFSKIVLVTLVWSIAVVAQTGSDKQFNKEGLTFDYPTGWSLQDDSDKDGQNLTFSRTDVDVQINVFVHRGRITSEKMPDARKNIVDPYINARMKQFTDMGGKPQRGPDQSQIGGVAAEGVVITANLGEPGAAKIYWALIGSRVVLLTILGPDKQLKQYGNVWDLIRNSIKIEDPKATPKP